jgi:hypothetical protein
MKRLPLIPRFQVFLIKFPLYIYVTPKQMCQDIYIQSITQPDKIRILTIPGWKFVVSVENVLSCHEYVQMTWLAYSPEGELCLMKLKIEPYEDDVEKFFQWEILGVV